MRIQNLFLSLALVCLGSVFATPGYTKNSEPSLLLLALQNQSASQKDERFIDRHADLLERQKLPESIDEWKTLGLGLLQLPAQALAVFQKLGKDINQALNALNGWQLTLVGLFIFAWFISFISLNRYTKALSTSIEQKIKTNPTFGRHAAHILNELVQRNILGLALIGGFIVFCFTIRAPYQDFNIIVLLALVWILVKLSVGFMRLILIEATDDTSGHDVRLYRGLRWALILGGVLGGVMIITHHVDIPQSTHQFIDRLFTLFMLAISIPLLKGHGTVIQLLDPYISKRGYIKRAVSLLVFLIPLIFLSSAAISFAGFFTLGDRIGMMEAQFLMILIAYVLLRGLISEGMDRLSQALIRHASNGWLLTQALLKPLHTTIRLLLIIASALTLFYLYGWRKDSPVGVTLTALANTVLFNIGTSQITIRSIVIFMIIFSVVLWATRWSREFAYRWLFSGTRDLSLRNSFSIFTQYAVVTIGFFIILKALGIDMTSLAILATALAVGLGFGLRDLANNFVSGVFLLIERPVRKGDIVTVNSFEGEVTHIGMRAFTIKTFDNSEVIVPNADAFSKAFTNWTYEDDVMRTTIDLPIDRKANPNEVKKIIAETISSFPMILTKPEPMIHLKEFTETAMVFEIKYFVNVHKHKRPEIKSNVLFDLWERLGKANIEIAHPETVVRMLSNKAE